MKPEIKAKWVAALRSGEYKQTRGALRTDTGMCCLGVLCELHAKECGQKWQENKYLGEKQVLPDDVQEWAELYDHRGVIFVEGDFALAALNDRGITFDWIAAIIEEEL